MNSNKFPVYRWSDILPLAGVVFIYALSVKLALAYLTVDGNISIVWIPSGVGLAVMLLGGRKYWPAIFIGAFFAYTLGVDRPWLPSAFIAMSNVLEPLLGYWLLTQSRIKNNVFDIAFTHSRDYLSLAATTVLSALMAATVGVITLWLAEIVTQAMVPKALLYWWMGNTLGIFTVTPLVLVWRTLPSLWLSRHRMLETITFFGLSFLFGQIIFLGWFNEPLGTFAHAYWMFIFVVWGAIRFGRHGCLLIIGVAILQALLGVTQHIGYFGDGAYALEGLWFYAMLLIGVGVTLVLVMHERKQASIKVQRISKLYAALGQCNQAIVRCTSEEKLFSQICHDAVTFGGMKMAWIGMIDEASQQVRPIACYGDSNEYLKDILISVDASNPLSNGPTGTSIRENRPFWCQDFVRDSHTSAWHERGAIAGWAASASLPLQRNGVVVGAFTLYAFEVNAFDEDIRNLLIEMAIDISFALDNYDREMRRKLTETKLQLAQTELVESRDRYADLYDFAPVGYLSISKNGMIAEVNWKVTAMFGLKRNQLNNHRFAEFVVDEEKERWQRLFMNLKNLNGGDELNFDMKLTHQNGSIFVANLNCLRMDDEVERQLLRVALLDVTQLNHAEEATRQIALSLQATIDAIPDLLFELGLNGRYYAVHTPDHHLLAAPSEDLVGKSVQEALPPAAAAVVMSALREADQYGRSQGKQLELDVPEGKRWFELSVSKKFKKRNESSRFIVLSRDITERKLAETALQASESHLRTIINIEPECIKIVDAHGRLKEMNPAGLAMIEADSQEQVVGYMLFDLITPEYQAAYAELHKRVLAGESGQLEFELIGLKGRHLWLETHAVPMLENGEKVLLGITRDITNRKLAEYNLRIAAIAFESREGMLVTDADKIILRVNRAFTAISGYSAEEAIGQTPRLVSSGHHNEDFYASMWESIDTKGGWEGEVSNRRKNGEVYPQQLTITAVKNNDGIVTNYVASFADITENKAAIEQIHNLAFFDPLTGLPNRRLLLDRLNRSLAANTRSGQQGALLFLDLDYFKTLNDTRGHATGDLLLQQVAERLKACVREGDTVSRLGGDEFVVLLEDLNAHALDAATQAEAVANKVLAALNQPYILATYEHRSTASIGITMFSHYDRSQDHNEIQEDMLKHADIAMYQAKKAGRNRLRFYDPMMQEAINSRALLEVDLHKAIDNSEFQLYYQIQVDNLGRPLGAEALIRWLHAERGLVSPYHFIPLAEETGLILSIGQWVLDSACAQIKAWQQAPVTRNLTLSINVSAKQFYQSDFATQVQDALLRHQINPMQLKLELTESILLEHVEDTITTMNTLRELGVRFSLDDFGTGYSSLQYLKLLPLYQLKIDRSFVRDIAIDSSDQAIVRTVIAMAQTLSLDVIAEGVETDLQRELLLSCGCNTYQGYLFGRPMPIEQFEASLKL